MAIGGGGLLSGINLAVKAVRSVVRVTGIEPTGSPTLLACLEAGWVVTLPEVSTCVPTMVCLRIEPVSFEIVRRRVEEIVLVTDEAMRGASRRLWFELGAAADLSGSASIAALRSRAFRPAPGQQVCAPVCGAGPDGIG